MCWDILRKAWRKKILIFAWTIPMIFILIISIESIGYTDLVTYQTPFNADEFAQILGAGGSLLLSFLLVVLYHKQAEIHRQAHEPYLIGEVESKEIVSSVFQIRNTGDGYAYDVSATWTIDGETREWKIPSLAPGDSFEFPLIIDENDNWVLNTRQIEEKLDQNTVINWEISCENRFGHAKNTTGDIDFAIQSTREDAAEIWEKEPVEEIRKSLDSIESDIGKITRKTRADSRDTKWETRSKQSLIISQVVDEYGEMNLEELSYLTGISEDSLEYRLSGLDQVNAVDFNDKSGVVRPKRPAASNHTLDDFI